MTVWLIISGFVRVILKKEIKMDFKESRLPQIVWCNYPVETEEVEASPILDLLGGAWGVIANVDWDYMDKVPGWTESAVGIRERYLNLLRTGHKRKASPDKRGLQTTIGQCLKAVKRDYSGQEQLYSPHLTLYAIGLLERMGMASCSILPLTDEPPFIVQGKLKTDFCSERALIADQIGNVMGHLFHMCNLLNIEPNLDYLISDSEALE